MPKIPSCVSGSICDFAHVVPWLRWTYRSLLTVVSISSSFGIWWRRRRILFLRWSNVHFKFLITLSCIHFLSMPHYDRSVAPELISIPLLVFPCFLKTRIIAWSVSLRLLSYARWLTNSQVRDIPWPIRSRKLASVRLVSEMLLATDEKYRLSFRTYFWGPVALLLLCLDVISIYLRDNVNVCNWIKRYK